MSAFLSILIILVCALLILVVLVQNSKGGGLASNFSSNNQVMGVRRTSDVLEKATWGFAIALFVLSLLASPKTGGSDAAAEKSSVTKERATTMPAAPAAKAPATGPTNPATPPAH